MEKLENVIIREISHSEIPKEALMGMNGGFVSTYYKTPGEKTPENGTPLILYNAEKNISIFGKVKLHSEEMKREQGVEYIAINVLNKNSSGDLIFKLENFLDYFKQ